MTNTTPDLTIPGSAVVELRVRLDAVNKILTALVGRIRHPESETAGLLRIALENAQDIVEAIEGAARGCLGNCTRLGNDRLESRSHSGAVIVPIWMKPNEVIRIQLLTFNRRSNTLPQANKNGTQFGSGRNPAAGRLRANRSIRRLCRLRSMSFGGKKEA